MTYRASPTAARSRIVRQSFPVIRCVVSAAELLAKRPAKRDLLQDATFATFSGMDRTITQRELRNNSAAILREVQSGRTIVVTRNGVPVAELRPVSPRRFVSRATIAEAASGAPRIDAARFRADLDRLVDQTAESPSHG